MRSHSKIANFICIAIICLFALVNTCNCLNKYSAEANKPNADAVDKNPTSLRELEKPFRMAKLNLLWSKAKHRLTDPKLQSLFSDLKIHDKEEIAMKHLKSDGKDPEGLKEAVMRKKLTGIMSTYDLLEQYGDSVDPKLLKPQKPTNDKSNRVAKEVFKNKKLNQLWAKAEVAGFTAEELGTLKEEFTHHQEKLDEYTNLLDNVKAGDTEKYSNSLNDEQESSNTIHGSDEDENKIPGGKTVDYQTKMKLMKEKHAEIRNGFDHLDRMTAKGPNANEFVEPKVQSLWRIAQQSTFTPDELASLKEELLHYERRLLKLKHLHVTAALGTAHHPNSNDIDNSTIEKSIKQQARTVEKLHIDLESKIMLKHVEL